MVQPKLIIHGGAGSALDGAESVDVVRTALRTVVEKAYLLLQQGGAAETAVMAACQLLEDDPLFNAGTGSVLQADGQVRMSAGFMVGDRQSFSGVINTSRVQNPIRMAQALQTSADRVVAESGAAELAREMGLPVHSPLTPKRLQEWIRLSEGATDERFKTSVAMGTIGVAALDQQGRLTVGTSTGGRGLERIGRVSDCAMPAGTYADAHAAVSCTGVGEDIIDEGLAARIVVRVADGMTLKAAMTKSFTEARSRQREFGAIALAANGDVAWDTTTDVLLAAYHTGEGIHLTL